MNGHIEADDLAEYRVGLITGSREREIAAHLVTCAQCTSVSDALAEVSVLLAAAPLPVLPATVAARLQAALNEQKPIPAEHSPSQRPVVTPARLRFKLPKVFPIRVLAPVAAVAVLAAGAFGLSLLGSTASSQSRPASAAAAAPAAGAASAVPSPLQPQFATGHSERGQVLAPEGSFVLRDSTVDFGAATLRQQLNSLLHDQARLRISQASASVRACVRTVAAGRSIQLVVSALYRGAPATVVVVHDSTRDQGLVAGRNCSATDGDILATAVVTPGISTP